MKIGRNEPCPCGSGKKYKRCCMNTAEAVNSEIAEELSHILAMNPEMSIDELNVVAQHTMQQQNQQGLDDFCGLTPQKMSEWLYAPFDEIPEIVINESIDLSTSPVMRYLELMIQEALSNDGSFKATAKGNLPTKLVKTASVLRNELMVEKSSTHISLSEFAGSNEDKFNALHYTRILAELAGIFYQRKGRFHLKKDAQKRYQKNGINAFFAPMLEAAVKKYNWGYLDGWSDQSDLQIFWMFLLWRVRVHSDFQRLIAEFTRAFPDFIAQLDQQDNSLPQQLEAIVQSRFIRRFLTFWGFAIKEVHFLTPEPNTEDPIEILPLFDQVFRFK